MITTRIIGGLGNQMFQYAAGRRLSHILGTKLTLDISSFNYYRLRPYRLNVFKIDENVVVKNSNFAYLPFSVGRINSYLVRKLLKLRGVYFKEKGFAFDEEVLHLADGAYLDGYWQSEKYFADIKEVIKSDFCFKNEPLGKNGELFRQIQAINSVSLHIRRGDYITNSEANQVHGVCDLDYYYRSIKFIAEKVGNPSFFIFSDDQKWVRNNLSVDYPVTYVDHNNGDDDFEDMRLMSLCKHNIIANSSFSWWGAWLNNYQGKIICAPQNWFRAETFNTHDLLPSQWHQI